MGDLFEDWKTIPNLLSFLRIIMVPIFAVLYCNGQPLWAILVLVLSGLSDFFDGKIARRYNQISALGKLLDPVADKLTQITIAIVLFLRFRESTDALIHTYSWIFLLFVGKELLMLCVAGVMLLCKIRPGAAEIWGKAATFVFYCVMIAIVLFGADVGVVPQYFPGCVLPASVTLVLVILSAMMTFVALFGYVPGVLRQFKEKHNEKKAK